MMDFNLFLLDLFLAYPVFVSLLAPFFFGDAGFIGLAFLSGLTDFKILLVLIFFGTIATVFNNICWFLFFDSKILKKKKFFSKTIKMSKRVSKRFKKFEKKSLLYFFLLSKFFFGTRLFVIMSMSMNKIDFKKFVFASAISSFIWNSILVSIAWLVGKGVVVVFNFFQGARQGLTLLVIVALVFVFVRKYIHHHSSYILFGERNFRYEF